MSAYLKFSLLIILTGALSPGFREKIKQQEDNIYSRHLQRHVKLTIISTEAPDNKNEMNLLLLNDGQDVEKFRVKQTVDSLYAKKLIGPLVVVAIAAGDRMQEYGVAGIPDFAGRGSSADKYSRFISNELYDFIKKKSGVRKFRSVAMAGCSLGGLSAFDVAWDNADKIDKVGVFSGSFWWRDKDVTNPAYSDNKDRIMLAKVRSSTKKPTLKYWFYAGAKEEEGDRDKDGIIDVVDDTKDLINIIKNKNICAPADIVYKESPDGKHDYPYWSKALPDFLTWAFGK